MSFCQSAHFHRSDELKDEEHIASVSPFHLGSSVLSFGEAFLLCCSVFEVPRFFAIIALLFFTVQEIR